MLSIFLWIWSTAVRIFIIKFEEQKIYIKKVNKNIYFISFIISIVFFVMVLVIFGSLGNIVILVMCQSVVSFAPLLVARVAKMHFSNTSFLILNFPPVFFVYYVNNTRPYEGANWMDSSGMELLDYFGFLLYVALFWSSAFIIVMMKRSVR